MGGNALKSVNLRRLGAKEYFELTSKISNTLSHALPAQRIALIPAYRSKDSFGDADYLVSSDNIPNVRGIIENHFAPKEIYANGGVYSFDVEDFQIDLILSSARLYDISYQYFSYNDISNLEGKVIHKTGAKYGHNGLFYVFRDGTYELGEIELSLNIDEILKFGGWSPEAINQYHKGFNDLEDIFQFVSSSEFFNPDIYLLDNLNHTARVRDRKRKTYNSFLIWCQENNGRLKHYPWNPNKNVYIERIQHFFPNFDEELDKLKEKRTINLIRAAKFNGHIVKESRGLEGAALGDFIIKFKKCLAESSKDGKFESYLDSHSNEEVTEEIRKFNP